MIIYLFSCLYSYVFCVYKLIHCCVNSLIHSIYQKCSFRLKRTQSSFWQSRSWMIFSKRSWQSRMCHLVWLLYHERHRPLWNVDTRRVDGRVCCWSLVTVRQVASEEWSIHFILAKSKRRQMILRCLFALERWTLLDTAMPSRIQRLRIKKALDSDYKERRESRSLSWWY